MSEFDDYSMFVEISNNSKKSLYDLSDDSGEDVDVGEEPSLHQKYENRMHIGNKKDFTAVR